MGDVVKVVLWIGLSALVAVAVVLGFGVFRLSQIFPDADEGEAIGEQIESEIGTAHPEFTVDAVAHVSFAEVSVDIRPVGGDLGEQEVSALLGTLQTIAAEHADSRWSLDSVIIGRWENIPVEIEGSAADQWPAMSPVLEVVHGHRTALTFSLDTGRVVIERDLDTERLCGAGTDGRDFFTDTVREAGEMITEVGWVSSDAPILVYAAGGCEGPLRTSLHLSGSDRPGRVEDLQGLVASLPGEQVLTGVTVRDSGELEIALEEEAPGPLAASLARAWPHGQLWINGTSATP